MKKYGILSIFVIIFLFSSMVPLNSTANHDLLPPDAEQLNLGSNTILIQNEPSGRHYYYFEPELNQFYKFELKVFTQSAWGDMYISDANGTYFGSIHSEYGEERYPLYAVDSKGSGNFSISVYSSGNLTREYSITISKVSSPDAYLPSDTITLELNTPQILKVLPRTDTFLEINLPSIDPYAISISQISGNITIDTLYSADLNQSNFGESVGIPIGSKGYFNPSSSGLLSLVLRGGVNGEIRVEITQELPPDGYSFDYPLSVGSEVIYNEFYRNELYIKPVVELGSSYLLNFDLNTSSSIFSYYVIVRDALTEERISEIISTSNSDKMYFYFEQPVVIEFQIYLYNDAYQGGISLQFEQTDTLPHSTKNDAETINIGSNHVRSTGYPNQEYWFQFTAPSTQEYGFDLDGISQFGFLRFEIYSESGNQRGQAGTGSSISLNLLSGDSVFIKVRGSKAEIFNLQIFEGQVPDDITEMIYSKNLQEGDYFSWQVESLINGVPASDNQEVPFPNESIIRLEVLQDAPVYNPNEDSLGDYFAISIDNNQSSVELPPSFFISPMDILIDGHSLASGIEVLRNDYYFDVNSHIQEVDGKIIITSELNEFSEGDKLRVEFDATNLNMISFEMDLKNNGDEIYLKLTQIEAQVSGPSTDDDLKENEPALNLPFPTSSFGISILAVMLICKKYNSTK